MILLRPSDVTFAEGKSDRTGVVYGQSITAFAQWLDKHDRPATLDERCQQRAKFRVSALRRDDRN